MPSPTSAYNATLRQARQITLNNGKVALSRLQSIFQSTADRAAEIIGTSDNPYTIARAASMRSQVLETLQRVEVQARSSIITHRDKTVEEVVKAHRSTVASIASGEGISMASVAGQFSEVPARTLAVLAARGRNAANFRTLVNRHMQEAAGSLDALIHGGIGTGQSARSLAKDIASLIVGESIKAGQYGLDQTSVSGLKTIWYDARRIAVSEINNAYRESNHQSLVQSEVVEAVQWQLSGRHHIYDECDEIAEGSSEGYDPGFYTLEEWPEAPHPFCMCGQGAVQLKPVDEWFEGVAAEEEAEVEVE
jgi:hypothetical protein